MNLFGNYRYRRSPRSGCAILVVMVLLAAMVLMVMANTTTLHLLNQELDQIDKQQQKKYGQDSPH